MVITLEQAKAYLQVDFELDDAIIEQCIKSAVSWVETYTGYLLDKRDVTLYTNDCGVIDTCLYPFSVVTSDVKVRQKATSAILTAKPNEAVQLKVGDWDGAEPPQQLISACYKLITYMYENRDMYPVTLPTDVQMLVNPLRRSATL